MDVANYLSELLGELGEVNVPGLGYFATLRSDGYYSESENTFYPPVNHINFEPQSVSDDVLVKYIAQKKNISLASSKYFTQKYIDDLRNRILAKETPLADLGTLFFQEGQVHFKSAGALTTDPSFFGYEPIKMEKVGDTSLEELLRSMENGSYTQSYDRPTEFTYTPPPPAEPETETASATEEPKTETAPATEEPEYTPPPIVEESNYTEPPIREEYTFIAPPEPVLEPEPRTIYKEPVYTPPVYAPQAEEEDFIFKGRKYDGSDDDDEPRRRPLLKWILIGLFTIIVLAFAGLYALRKYKPATYDRMMGIPPPPVIFKKPDTLQKKAATDTAKKIITDTTAKAADSAKAQATDTHAKTVAAPLNNQPAVIDTFAHRRYEISGGAFGTLEQANNAIANFEKMGFPAHIMKHALGKRYHITLGTYFIRADAISAENKMLNTGKVTEETIGVQAFNPTNPTK